MVDKFLRRLQRAHLAARGFERERRSFRRAQGAYTEIYTVATERRKIFTAEGWWAFFLHAEITLAELPAPILGFGASRAHWVAHAETLAGRPHTSFEVFMGENEEELAAEIAGIIDLASAYVAAHLEEIRTKARELNLKCVDSSRGQAPAGCAELFRQWEAVAA